MKMKIIEAIQERLGPQYATLPDAIGWYSGPQALREDFTGEYYFKEHQKPVKQRLSQKREDLTLNEKICGYISREVFVYNLEDLLRRADLEVEKLRYIYPDTAPDRAEAVEITFKTGFTRRVCIEADSRAAIIKDVLRGCE